MNKVLIIAEAGVNHNGDITLAQKLVEAAKESGADVVKFQTFNVDNVVSEHAQMADYQKKNLGVVESQKEMLRKLALSQEDFIKLADYCKQIGIGFLSTPFDTESVDFLNELQDVWKIPSGEITNYPYLVKIAKTGKDIILSTGMSTMNEVEDTVSVLRDNGAGSITLLHCTTNYPTPMQDVNLRAMLALKEHFGYDVGYSDHTRGIEVPIAAVALGAVVIEKHFTVDRTLEGPDHKASLEPYELAEMVRSIRNIELAMGEGTKTPAQSELSNIAVARKSIIAAKDIQKGEIFTEENITSKRPGTGICPMRWNEILGRRAKRDFYEDELIEI